MKKLTTLLFTFISICLFGQNPQLLKDVFPGNNSGTIQNIVKTTGYTFFNEDDDDADADRSLFRTDGTNAGTIKLDLTYPGYISTKAEMLTPLGNKVVFAGDNFQGYGEIWASDGTQAGTVAIERFQPLNSKVPVVELKTMGSYTYYSVINKDAGNVNRAYLRRTDGTAGGTSLVYDFSAFTGVPQVVFLTPVNNILYFIVYDQFGSGADQLWRSDGTTAGTYMVYDFTTANFVESFIMPAGNNFYIMIGSVVGGVRQNTIWKSDGTTAGTVPVKLVGTGNPNTYPPFAAIGNTLYFAGVDGNGKELWQTDGTAAGTYMAADINPGAGNSNPSSLVALNNVVYFSATTPTSGTELWKYSSGVASLVKDINPGANGSGPGGLTVSDNTIVFGANNGTNGGELWITDGTSKNTVMVADINPSGNAVPNTFTGGNPVYFAANNGTNGFEVFKYDNNGDVLSGPRKYYVNDNSLTGDLFTFAVGNNNNNGSKAYPFATISYAVTQVQPGDSIYVDAGTYVEQVTLDKGITIIGAGQNLTSILKPAVTVPPPGPFTEQGLIQTAQNIGDVHIKDISVTGDYTVGVTPIVIQSGGSVKNCKVQSGNQGIFVRVDPGTNPSAKTFVIENNLISAEYIALNIEGTNLTASLINNDISALNPGFSTGVFAGADFGSLPNFIATGNKFSNYVNNGFFINANNSTVSQNSFLGTGTIAIEKIGGNTLNATCNWFGSSNQFVVASKISGNVNFNPWLVNGTDNDPAIGFQPVPNSCTGKQKFYVNDNSLTGDVYTTAIGNNSNNGSASAPLATITAALAKTQAGDTIIVDAGNYTEVVNVTKNITIRGAGMGVTILNGPAAHIVPPSGAFESGIIQSTAGLTDVIIEKLTIDGSISDESHGTFIQGGGRISNCELRYVNDGFYFQYISAQPRTAIGENNYVHHINYVGSLFAGNGITAIANNNVIDLNGALYGIGFIAGYGGDGNVASFTASNNSIINFNGFGVTIGSLQTAQFHNNSITRVTGNYLSNAHTVNIDATCNWYGTTDAGAIIPYVTGAVSYSPWLSNGTDNDVAFGFQPAPGSCNGRQNKFYVNDNNLTGDIFTSAVGNDANAGIPSSPLLTISAALAKASAGDSIFVDAGTYAMANLTINKSITILGTNYLISPNNTGDKTLYNTSRNAESRITGGTLVMQADWVNVNGMRISSNTAISVSGNYSHIKMDKNYFDMATTASTVNLSGSSTANDYAITDNRFERQDASSGDGVFLSAVASSWIDNNTFIELNASPFRGFALRTAGNNDVSNVIFTNNYVKKLQVGVLPFRVQSLLVSNNMFDSCSAGYNQTPQGSVSNNVTISGNTFNNIRVARSILVRGGTNGGINNLNISGNTINQAVDGINGIVGMIQLDYAVANAFGTTTVSGNKINISGNYANTNVGSNVGIMIVGEHTNTTITGNELTFTAINATSPLVAVLPPVPTGVYINTDPGANSGLIPSNAIINITNNKFNGFKSSIGFYDPSASNLTPNIGYGYLTTGAQVNIHENSFVNDSMSIDNGAVSENINATCNFYNAVIPEVIITKISPQTGDYVPWLINGTDNEPLTTGFQPVPGSCTGRVTKWYVNDAVTTGDMFTTKAGDDVNGYGLSTSPFATITRALQEAQAGDSIFVDAGTYPSGDITIDKGVKIIGTNYLLSPNDAIDKRIINSVRNAESIITGATLIIGSNDISIQGITMDPGVNVVGIFMNNQNYSNISAYKNRFKMNNQPAIGFRGAGVATIALSSLVSTGFVVDDNRFEKLDATNNNDIVIDKVKNVTVNNNAFVVSGATLRTHSAIVMGNNGVVDGVQFSNNTIDNALTAIGATRVANSVFSNNKIYNTTNALVSNNSIPESASQEFVNNILDGNGGILPFIQYTRGGGTNLGSSSSLKVENNTITATAIPGTTTLLGSMNLIFQNSVLNPSLIVRGNTINYGGNLSTIEGQLIRPIMVRGNLKSALIEKNEITLNGSNLQPKTLGNSLPVCPAITVYPDNGATSFIQTGSVINVLNNKIHGFKHSVVVFDAVNGVDPYIGFGNLPAGVTLNVNYNSFTGDSISINNGTTGNEINANCNWYGSSADQDFINKISLETVNPVPWLTNGTDSDPAVGFQPVAGACDGYPPVIVLDNYTNVTCNGANNGTIHITTTYGKAPFTYTWSKDGDAGFVSHDEDPTNLAPGTYHLSVVDGNGSSIFINSFDGDGIGSITVTITEPPVLTTNANGTNVSCYGGNNGTASVTAGGGTTPYSYLWSNGGTNASITNLTAGLYTVTVTDGNGCTKTASYQVTQPPLLTAVATGTSTSCANSATVVASGGTTPYSYSWSNGATTQSITSLPAGTYTVTVTDGNGCQTTANCTVTATEAFNPSASVVDVSCFGGSNGSITVTNANGVAPFQYSINGVTFQSSNTFNGLAAGTYTITVKDVNGCTGFVSKTVIQPTQLVVSLSAVQSTCAGSNTGSITVVVSGGSPTYSYQWTGPNSYTSTQKNISGLAAGNYNLIVTDSKGCTASLPVTVNPFPAINLTANVTNVSCPGSANGSIDLTVTGGTGSGFTYLWNNGATTEDRSNLAPGTNYKVTITDIGSGCQLQNITYAISQPAALGFNSNSYSSDVNGCISMGVIYVEGAGGTSPYQYKLNYNGVYQSSGLFQNLPGTATGIIDTVWMKDSKGCTYFKSYTIKDDGKDMYENNNSKNNASAINLGATISSRIGTSGDVDYFKLSPANTWTGTYTVSFVQPATAVVFDLVGSNGSTIIAPTSSASTYKQYTGLNGTYFVRVSGANSSNCYQLTITSGLLTRSSGNGNTQQEVTKAKPSKDLFNVTAFPNPSNSSFNVKIESGSEELMNMRVMDASGKLIEERKNIPSSQIVKLGERYINGVYLVEIIQGNNRKTVRLVKM